MAKNNSACTCPASVYGGFKQGTGIALGLLAVALVPLGLVVLVALPAYLDSLASKASADAGALKGFDFAVMR